jgi:cytochrome c-type biogenesis protein CcmH
MSTFVFLAAAMVVAALALVLRPLLAKPGAVGNQRLSVKRAQDSLVDLRRSHDEGSLSAEEFEVARARLALELLDAVNPAIEQADSRNTRVNLISAAAIAVLVPVSAITLYWNLGASELLSPDPLVADAGTTAANADPAPSVEVLLEKVVTRLEENPEDIEGWEILARSYLQTGRFADARDAYARLYALVGDRPDVMVGYAESMARAADGDLSGRPQELLEAVLRLDSGNQQALWLAGLASVQRGDKESAKNHWQQLLDLQEPGSESATTLKTHIAELDTEDTASPARPVAQAPTAASNEAALNGAWLQASVSLDPSLQNQVNGDDTLFVYARVPNGPRMPVALARHTVSELPLSVRLDDSMAMMPQLKLSNFADVEVVARISKSGQATPQSGDLIGSSGEVAVGTEESIDVTISKIVP